MSAPQDTPASYFVWKDETQDGPFSDAQLFKGLMDGSLTAKQLVWTEGMDDWQTIADYFGVSESFGSDQAAKSKTQKSSVEINGGVIVELSCKACGGRLDYHAGDETASCPFCGSNHVVHVPQPTERLRDLENSALRVSHYGMLTAVEEAPKIIIDAIKAEKAGLKNPEELQIEVDAAYFPVWRIDANVQCAWHGEYSETRTVVKYRKVTKTRPNGSSYEENEPYNTTETIWHPQSGSNVFSTTLYAPAAAGFSQAQLDVLLHERDAIGDKNGHPRSINGFAVAKPTKSQNQSWSEFRCNDRIESEAYRECRGCIERLNDVRSVVSSKAFSLLYLPIAVVSYDANGSRYRHFVNLQSGGFSGDLPLDEATVRDECVEAGRRQKRLDQVRGIAGTIFIAVLGAISVELFRYYLLRESQLLDHFGQAWLYGLGVGLPLLWWMWRDCENPWQEFVWSRRAYLLRILAHPPPELSAPMHKGQDVESIQRQIMSMAEANSLENIARENAMSVLAHPATTLLRWASPSTAFRLPLLVKVAMRLATIFAAMFFASEYPPEALGPRLPVTPDAVPPRKTGAALSTTSHTRVASTETRVLKAVPIDDDQTSVTASPAVEPLSVAPSSTSGTAPPSESSTESGKQVRLGEPLRRSTHGPLESPGMSDQRLLNAKAELAALESTIESERLKWQNALKTINTLTNFKRTPVRQNSPAHLQCMEASKVINDIERKAPEIKAKKARLEAIIKELEK